MAEEIDDDMLEEVNDENGESDVKISPIKKLLSNKIFLISIIAVFVILLAVGSYFLFFTSNDESTTEAEPTEITESQDASSQQEQVAENQLQPEESPSLSDISGHLGGDPATQGEPPPANLATEKPSRLSQISSGMVEAAKNGGIVANSDNDATNTTPEQLAANPPPTKDAKLLSDLLAEKVAALEEENKQLKDQISKLEIQIKLFKNTQRAEALSVPIDKFSTDSNVTATGTYNDGLIHDYTNDYSASPYADESMTPKPTWGDNKPEVKK